MVDTICNQASWSFYKANITRGIGHLITFVIYTLILYFFVKIFIIILDKKALIIDSVAKYLKHYFPIGFERAVDNSTYF